LTNGRLFFIQWQSKNDKQLWKIGLQQPGQWSLLSCAAVQSHAASQAIAHIRTTTCLTFSSLCSFVGPRLDFHWDYADTLASYPGCRLSLSALRERAAHERVQGRPGTPPPPPARILAIAGSIVASHPLAGSMDALYQQGSSLIWGLTDRTLQRFLLRPNVVLQSWINAVVQGELARSESDPSDFAGVIGVQVRSGYADAADLARRPPNANFLAPGDEERFVAAVENILRTTRFGADPRRAKVFLTTDSPDVRTYIENALRSERFSAKALASGAAGGATADAAAADNGSHSVSISTAGQASASAAATDATEPSAGSGLQVVSVRSGHVAHCGPLRSTDAPSVLRMLTEWFILSRHVDYAVVTAWSLFGASAVEGMSENFIHRIDASNCGHPGAKPCQRG
jgi:hypothetical protein